MKTAAPTRARRQPEVTRAAILEAATEEFASAGIDGARTDEIARSAGVNKALLYYYFKDKEALYGAVLDQVYSGLMTSILGAIDAESDPARRILAYAGAHFDYIAKSPFLPKLVSREMMRSRGMAGPILGASPHMARIADQFLRPLQMRVAQTLREGIQAGAFRPVDPEEFLPTMVGVIVFYFISLPVASRFTSENLLSPERLAKRRAAVLDFISAALFRPAAPRQASGEV